MTDRDDEVSRLRVPPHSTEAEQSVLGGLLLDNSAWDRAGDLLTESDFYRYEHRHIYAAIGALVNAAGAASNYASLFFLDAPMVSAGVLLLVVICTTFTQASTATSVLCALGWPAVPTSTWWTSMATRR